MKPSRAAIVKAAHHALGAIGSPFATLGRPVFVIGTGRCGSTLLARILRSHGDIAVYPGEANDLWHPSFYPFPDDSTEIAPIEVDPVSFTTASVSGWPSNHADRIRRTFLGYHLRRGSRNVLCVRSAMISHMIPVILDLFPDATFVHLYRNGPAVVDSYVRRNFGRYASFDFTEAEYRRICARYWNTCIFEIDQRVQTLALDANHRSYELKYERLCHQPRETLASLFRFLGVSEDGYTFDISQIADRTHGNCVTESDLLSIDIGNIVMPAMRAKGYVC